MSDDDIYQPISCSEHSNYELAIMHRQKLHLVWKDAYNHHNINTITPLDLQTSKSEEFLIAENLQGEKLKIRLDHIISCKHVK